MSIIGRIFDFGHPISSYLSSYKKPVWLGCGFPALDASDSALSDEDSDQENVPLQDITN